MTDTRTKEEIDRSEKNIKEKKDLNVKAHEEIKSKDIFGKHKGIAGTLQLTKKENSDKIISTAWDLSEATELPVIVVVRAV